MKKGFSLVELLISLIVISCITAAFTPLITKKFATNIGFGSGGGGVDLSTDCVDKFGSDCSLCTSSFCVDCNINCAEDEYIDSKICKCQKCVDKYGAGCNKCDSTTCLMCPEGQYYDSVNACVSCATKFPNCKICNNEKCLTCEEGYNLSEDPVSGSVCSGEFNCSGDNFIQVGNLCVTKKNMGDSEKLTIPSLVTVCQSNQLCHLLGDTDLLSGYDCCWKGYTTTNCDDDNGGYSGCTRTVCDWKAADKICKNFHAGNLTWRLPTKDEVSNWGFNSIGLGVNGLLLCDDKSGNMSAYCGESDACNHGSYNPCYINYVWTNDTYIDVNDYFMSYSFYLTDGSGYVRGLPGYWAASVRCVADLPKSCEEKISKGCSLCDDNNCYACGSKYIFKNGKCVINNCAVVFGDGCIECKIAEDSGFPVGMPNNSVSSCTACADGYELGGGATSLCGIFSKCTCQRM